MPLIIVGTFLNNTRLLLTGRSSWTLLQQYPLDRDLSSTFGRHYSVAREARFIKKLVTGTKHSRRKWFGGEAPWKSAKEMSFLMNGGQSCYRTTSPKQKSGRVLRRVGVLSTVFMENITSLLATGEVSTEILGLGMEITQVKISSDFTCVNVYWYSSESEKEAKLEAILPEISGKLRHLLSQLRVISGVPPVKFVKDTKYTRLLEVENILAKLDFGEDYEPTPLGHNYKVAMSAPKKMSRYKVSGSESVSESLGQSLLTMEDGGDPSKDEDEEGVGVTPRPPSCPSSPSVRQDMLGLDWDGIMGAIQLEVSRERRKEANRNRAGNEGIVGVVEDSQPPRTRAEILEEVTRNVNRQKEFMEFLKQRRVLRSKEEKRHSTAAKEREFLEQEKESRRFENVLELKDLEGPEDYLEDEDNQYDDKEAQRNSK